MRFLVETGDREFLADSVEAWADLILSDDSMQTGWKLAHEWRLGSRPRSAATGQAAHAQNTFHSGRRVLAG